MMIRKVQQTIGGCVLAAVLVLAAQGAMAQKNLAGIVKDQQSGQPLIGATVFVKGTTDGTTTDENGRFALAAGATADSLSVSMLGYQTQSYGIGSQTYFEFLLAETNFKLNEVVVVGYGTSRKRDLTGSAVSIKGSDIANIPALTAAQAIQGKVAGVQIINRGEPGGAPTVRIRGTGSIIGGADPLYVVDGVITEDIRNVNNADIVSIDILKDASSTAIYGVRAANGVVLITTKAGQEGKPVVSYEVYSGAKMLVNKVKMANPNWFVLYANEATGTFSFTAGDVTGETDWYDEVTRVGLSQNHNLSISGSTNRSTYYFSVGYLKENGVLKGNDYERFTVRTNNTYRVSDAISVGNNVGIAYTDVNNKPFSLFTDAYNALPIYDAKDETTGEYGYTLKSNVGNPLAKLEYTNDQSRSARVQGNLWAEVKPLVEGLVLRTSFGVDGELNRSTNYSPIFYVASNQRNDASSLTLSNSDKYRWIWDNIATYQKSFGQQNLKLMVGHTAEKFDGSYMTAYRPDVFPQKQYWNLLPSSPNFQTVTGGPLGDYGTRESYYARASYMLAARYLVTATFRRDGSSKFPAENRWANFPSIGLGWVLTEEAFFKNQNLFDNLKVRLSYGLVGNDRIRPGEFVPRIAQGLNYVLGVGNTEILSGATITDVIDPNLKWETTREVDFGLEFSMLDNALVGEIDLYSKYTQDALFYKKLPTISGDDEYLTNAADISNRGIEFNIAWNNTVSPALSYTTRFNATLNRNRVENLGTGRPTDYASLRNGRTAIRVDEGQPIGSFYVYQTDGIFQNNEEIDAYPHLGGAQPGDWRYVDTNNDGKIDAQDKVFAGSYQPKLYFGLNGTIQYKRWDIAYDFYGNLGNEVYNGKSNVRFDVGYNVEDRLARNRWTPTNPTNEYPRATNGTVEPSTFYVESGNFFRINNLTLGYSLPKETLDRLRLQRLRVYLAGQNVWTFQAFSGFSPELAGSPTEAGIELDIYPISTIVLLGANVQF